MDVKKKDVLQVSCERKKLLEEFSSSVSLHGFHYLFKERGIRRLIWFLITFLSFNFSAILFYSILTDYLEYKSLTTFSKTYDLIDAVFPTLSFCPINFVSNSKLEQLQNTYNISANEFISMMEKMNPNLSKEGFNWSDSRAHEFLEMLTKQNVTSVQQMMELYEINLTEMLEDDVVKVFSPKGFCNFDGRICTVQDFHDVRSWDAALCSQFNRYKENKTLKIKSVHASGFTIFMNLNVEDSYYSKFSFEGMVININSYGTPHQDPTLETENIVLSPGTINMIQIRLRKVNLLPPPYSSNCGSKKYHLVRHYPYTKAMCQIDCILNIVYQKCGCVGYDVQDYVDVKICDIKDFISCYLVHRKVARTNQSGYCESHCPLQCERTTYDISTSQATLGNNVIYRKMRRLPKYQNMTKERLSQYVRNNMLGVYVNFKDFSVLTETVVPSVSWTSLLGAIGGSIGLCLGFSFITAFEFLFFLYDYLTIPCKSNRHYDATHTDENAP